MPPKVEWPKKCADAHPSETTKLNLRWGGYPEYAGANADCSCIGKCLARHFNKPAATFSMCGRWAPGDRSFHGIHHV